LEQLLPFSEACEARRDIALPRCGAVKPDWLWVTAIASSTLAFSLSRRRSSRVSGGVLAGGEMQTPASLKRESRAAFQAAGVFFIYRKSAERSRLGADFICSRMHGPIEQPRAARTRATNSPRHGICRSA
jgi:hypothetical protein